jgi:hypothetical protein
MVKRFGVKKGKNTEGFNNREYCKNPYIYAFNILEQWKYRSMDKEKAIEINIKIGKS